ncbi:MULTISPECIES: hypothetical protein [Halocynthiibacter]|uniref:Uncharacterized protein n=1 Tax=Halocynthiibacter halioticoli TaxID=2986804 RepID=A0AAE3LSW4_9RHOB|nr:MULTISPECIES: hypothetical protein [Halocynthiibacter]MCV6826019.1 hypothetical protein [Halocynthiibacter halioticoli]MCW4059020.1 hypothetical protein [Halocynthiibacter sp. SDUM655004]
MVKEEVIYFYIPEFENSVKGMSSKAVGAYVLALMAFWKNGGCMKWEDLRREVPALVETGDTDWLGDQLLTIRDDGYLTPSAPAFHAAAESFGILKDPQAPIKPEREIAPVEEKTEPKFSEAGLLQAILKAARIKTPEDQPLFWQRREHQIEAVKLVNDSGLSSEEVIARLEASDAQPELRRIAALAPLLKSKGRASR